ncbi:MAG: ROK family transcriptional regulator [Paracoccaceae bacterium]
MPPRPAQIAGTNAERTKAHNRRIVLGYLTTHEQAGRAEIAQTSGLSTQTVSNIIAELETEGLVAAAGRRAAARGQPPVLYACIPDGAAAFGFEVRPDALLMALVNLGGSVLATQRMPLSDNSPETVLPLMAKLTGAALRKATVERARVLGAGLVVPGSIGPGSLGATGATELRGWDRIDIAAAAGQALDLPVIVEKDATAAAIAEGLRGLAQGMDSYCYLYFGAGIGLGVVSRGVPLRGAHGHAGEIGHTIVRPGGLPCPCGNRGCLEQYASRMSLQRRLGRPGEIDSATLERLFASRRQEITDWSESAAATLSQTIGLLENLFDPQTVILGGAMPDEILDDLIAHLALPVGSVAHRPNRTAPRVQRGSSGRMTAALGGAALVIHDTVTPRLEARS